DPLSRRHRPLTSRSDRTACPNCFTVTERGLLAIDCYASVFRSGRFREPLPDVERHGSLDEHPPGIVPFGRTMDRNRGGRERGMRASASSNRLAFKIERALALEHLDDARALKLENAMGRRDVCHEELTCARCASGHPLAERL